MQVHLTFGLENEQLMTIMGMDDGLVEVPPELIYEAAQRVGMLDRDGSTGEHMRADLRRIIRPEYSREMRELLRRVRVGIDTYETPSMMVGNTITMLRDSGRKIVTHTCNSVGWSSEQNTVIEVVR